MKIIYRKPHFCIDITCFECTAKMMGKTRGQAPKLRDLSLFLKKLALEFTLSQLLQLFRETHSYYLFHVHQQYI